jgi:hypothetical protein
MNTAAIWRSSCARPLSELNYEYTVPAATFKIDGYRRKVAEILSLFLSLGGEEVIKVFFFSEEQLCKGNSGVAV